MARDGREGLGGRRDGELGTVQEKIRAGRRRRTVAKGALAWPMTVDGARCQPKSACLAII